MAHEIDPKVVAKGLEFALTLAFDITALVPGLGTVSGALRLARDTVHINQQLVEFFQTPEGHAARAAIENWFKVRQIVFAIRPDGTIYLHGAKK